ncbi:MAG: succinylglutamate-semialdehyde dehydrogenase, partial [Alphaproteobacteria bacterium]|nr:succinylglutamate-semialdehyde dehydrogenase [Alphaproteobacteria bacterium]
MSSEVIVSIEPATGAEFWRAPVSEIEAEIALARESWPAWATQSLSARVETMRRFANVVRGKSEDLINAIARETGKPLWDARAEIESTIARVEIAIAGYMERSAQRRIDGALGARSALRHKPHGVIAVITSHAAPADIPTAHILPALIAGNAVLFKPSEKTPATGKLLIDCLHAAGLPTGVARIIIGGPEVGEALATHPDVNGLTFTGTARNGIMLHRRFADMPHKLLSLEMGGNNPIVVWNAPDMHSAAVVVVQSAFLSAGQRCTAARRLIVEDGKQDALLAEIRQLMNRLIVGEPHSSPPPYMGPVIDNAAADQLQEAFLDMMTGGGRPIRHLDRPVAGRPFLSPALIDVTDIKERSDTELFGPILQLIRVPDFDAAVAEACNTRFGLSAALIGGTPKQYEQFWANSRAGLVHWNRATNSPPVNAPLGGVGLSGNHRPGATYAADYCAYPVVS